ncbi:hypothetical protein TNCV_3108271 [Trichonephila clavipes]|uniref:Transposase n=1 Tax=Trichonephila clavipes TaxID=2585209 RepID=A0A8X6S7D5_TRICX|nr:hypothetical protein TNCV_3108271 [Trichonephila clavipes]
MASAFSRSNPIENVWDALGRQVAGRNYPPTNKNTLIRALTEEWDKLPQQLLDNVVQSMTIKEVVGSSLDIRTVLAAVGLGPLDESWEDLAAVGAGPLGADWEDLAAV